MMKKVFIYTYGCQMNVHDSEKMVGVLSEDGYMRAESPEDADLIIFNTCAIREKAEQKFFSQLGRIKGLKRKKQHLKIAVAGCVAQESRKKIFSRAPHVDLVFGPQNISFLKDMLGRKPSVYTEENPLLHETEFTTKRDSSFRAWVSIMYGCNNFCSYCIVPYTRGREVSRPSASILEEIRQLVGRGYKEVTLLGQNVNSYASDKDFAGLLRAIDSLGLSRVRFVTSHPRDISDDLINAFTELPSLCEHIHLPLQSGSDRILQLMNRGYSLSEYKFKIDKLRAAVPGIAVTSDIIIGFPGETDEEYEMTLRAIKEIDYDGLFAFKYSKRRGTKASSLDGQIPDELKGERLNRLLKAQDDISLRKNTMLEGTIQNILVEGAAESDSSMISGRTRTNKIVVVKGDTLMQGTELSVEISRARLHSLEGIMISPSSDSQKK